MSEKTKYIGSFCPHINLLKLRLFTPSPSMHKPFNFPRYISHYKQHTILSKFGKNRYDEVMWRHVTHFTDF